MHIVLHFARGSTQMPHDGEGDTFSGGALSVEREQARRDIIALRKTTTTTRRPLHFLTSVAQKRVDAAGLNGLR